MTLSYINSRTINHFVIYSYTVLYGFNQLLTNPFFLLLRRRKRCEPPKTTYYKTFL